MDIDQDQTIDYTNKYNENIGSISPQTLKAIDDSHYTSYHSENLYETLNSESYDQVDKISNKLNLISNFENNCFQSNSKNWSDKMSLNYHPESNDFIMYEGSVDTVNIYNVESSPICFSSGSSLSNVSMEYISNFNNPKDQELSTSDEYPLDYHVENSPTCFSYDSPLSSLSLNLSYDGNISPLNIDFLKNRIQANKEQEFSTMVHKTNSKDNCKKLKDDINNSVLPETKKELSFCENRDYKIRSSQSSLGSLSNDNHSNFEKGFELIDNDELCVNSCISSVRFSSTNIPCNYNNLNDYSSAKKTSYDDEYSPNSKEEIPYFKTKILPFTKEEVYKGRAEYNKLSSKQSKKIGSLESDNDSSTTVSFYKKYCSRSMYKIDGEEEGKVSSVPFAAIVTPINTSKIQESTTKNYQTAAPVIKTKKYNKIFNIFKKNS